MALWQFQVELAPRERIGGRTEISAEEFEAEPWWRDRQPPPDFRERLAALAAPVKSWHEQLLWFGGEDGDRIDVWLESGRVQWVRARIDCRRPTLSFVEGLLRVAGDWSCGLVEKRYRKVLPANLPD